MLYYYQKDYTPLIEIISENKSRDVIYPLAREIPVEEHSERENYIRVGVQEYLAADTASGGVGTTYSHLTTGPSDGLM